MNPKICILPNAFQTHYTMDFVNALSRSGVNITFMGSDRYDPATYDPRINYHRFIGSHDEHRPLVIKLARLAVYYGHIFFFILFTRIRLFHIFWVRFYMIDGIAIPLLLKLFRKKIVYTAHNVLPHDKGTRRNRLIFSLIYRLMDLILVHSEEIKASLCTQFNIPDTKIRVIKHGVYTVIPQTLTLAEARRQLSLGSEEKVLLFFGRIAPYKGVHTILEAYQELIRQDSAIKLVIAGKVEKDFIQEWEQLCAEQPQDNLLILSDFIPDEKVALLFAAANVLLLPYLEGSQSGALFMSYANGLPVIASEIGSFPRDIIPGKTGYLFPPRDVAALIKRIHEGFASRLFIPETSRESIRQFANETYSWDDISAIVKDFYSEL
jgi:glycosyltransferase involved in cell wall biosynthesis